MMILPFVAVVWFLEFKQDLYDEIDTASLTVLIVLMEITCMLFPSELSGIPDLIIFEVLTIPQVLHGQVNLGVEENEANHRNKAWAEHKLNKLIFRFSPVVNPQTHVW